MSNTKNPPAPKQHIHTPTQPLIICDVWEDNFEEEFAKITSLIEKYKTIGMVLSNNVAKLIKVRILNSLE